MPASAKLSRLVRTWAAMPGVLLLCALTAGVGQASVGAVVYHSPADDGSDPGAPVQLSGLPAESLYLYVDAGALVTGTGSACLDGDGQEICAYRFCVEASDLVDLVGFAADPAQDVVASLDSERACATGGNAGDGELGPVRIGELIVSSSGAGTLEVVEGSVVGADLALGSVPPRVLALPEPSLGLQLGVGLAFLFAVRRCRGGPR